jgi:hypothetical protein
VDGSVRTLKGNAAALVAVCKEAGLEVNADTTKCMVMSRIRTQDEVSLKGWSRAESFVFMFSV